MLASIGLLNAAYRHLALTLPTKWLGPDLAAAATIALAEAVGENGMVAGEALDLAARGSTPGLDALERIHALKTGSLFIAAIVEAGRLAGAGSVEQAALRAYAKNLGLAFQIVDDLLEVTSTPAQTGKDVTTTGGPTFVSLAGTDGARQIVHELIETAVQSLAPLGRGGARLCALARQSEQRDR
jgi:farnesyl diphosphate synthase/geranylgeranyl diphosphate synthase type II